MTIFLLCDTINFSNAVRKAYTQIKKAELLGGMGKAITRKVKDSGDIKDLIADRSMYKDFLKTPRHPSDIPRYKEYIREAKDNINKARKGSGKDVRSYTDAAQIARRGSTKPIKSASYIDRAGYIQHPQDNTVLASTLKKVETNTLKSGKENGVSLYKNNNKLKTTPMLEGDEGSVGLSLPPKNQKTLIQIHSHPLKNQTEDKLISKLSRIGTVIPSAADHDSNNSRGITNLIVSPHAKGKRTITKYTTKKDFPDQNRSSISPNSIKNHRKNLRSVTGVDYTVITPNKNQ